MSEQIKRYAWSTLVTFLAGMSIVIVPTLNETLTLEVLKSGAYAGVVFSAVRVGLKLVLESFLTFRAGK